jgi:hypothetical protein
MSVGIFFPKLPCYTMIRNRIQKPEEAKRIKELLKNQINEKEESCCKLEIEIVDLRKKVENSNKFLNSSLILDEIL